MCILSLLQIISKFDNLLIKSSTYIPAVQIPTAEELAEDGKIKLRHSSIHTLDQLTGSVTTTCNITS